MKASLVKGAGLVKAWNLAFAPARVPSHEEEESPGVMA